MAHKAEFVFTAASGDITARVQLWRFRHGANIYQNSRWFSVLQASGSLVLENGDNYWTETRIDSLGTINVHVDTRLVGACKLKSWEWSADRREVFCRLEGALADDYDSIVRVDAVADWTEAQVVAGAGVTVTPATPWEGWKADEGTCWCGSKWDFIRNLGTHANGIPFEDGSGGFGMLLPQTDPRRSSQQITFPRHGVELRSLRGQLRRGWRRNAQVVTKRDAVLTGYSYTLPQHTSLNNAAIFSITHPFGSNDVMRVTCFPGEAAGVANPREDHAFTEFSGALNIETIDTTRRYSEGAYYARGAGYLIAANIPRGDISTFQFRPENLRVRYADETFSPYYFTGGFTDTIDTIWEGDTPNAYLPRSAWPSESSGSTKFAEKVAWWNSVNPFVMRLEFPSFQPSETAWHEILDMPLGSARGILSGEVGLSARAYVHPMLRNWTYRANRASHLEIHFVSFHTIPNLFEAFTIDGGDTFTIDSGEIMGIYD